MEHLENTVVDFSQRALEQEKKGMEKYGKPLDPLDNYDWLVMAAEEQVDGYKYLLAEKKKREHITTEILKVTKDYPIHDQVKQLLEQLNNGRSS